MSTLSWIAEMARGRVAPALLVLLLCVRVATAAAVQCQHELADAARLAESTQQALRAEAQALGGPLCLFANSQTGNTAQKSDGPHLNTPCPFFKSPIALFAIRIDPEARIVAFSRLAPLTGVACSEAQAPAFAYSARAPPLHARG